MITLITYDDFYKNLENIIYWPPSPCSWQTRSFLDTHAIWFIQVCQYNEHVAGLLLAIRSYNPYWQDGQQSSLVKDSWHNFALYCLLSHKTSANPIKNLAEPLPHLFRPEASCRDNSLGTSSLKPALEQKQFASLLIFIHFHLAIPASSVSQIQSF